MYPRLLYIKTQGNKIYHPGSPVFYQNKKLAGIVSDTYCEDTDDGQIYYIHIIPMYYIVKTLEKKCNNQIYTNEISEITKINKYNVKNGTIYHPNLLIRIPLDVYFTLEGDSDKIILINGTQEYRYNEMKTIISNERTLLKEEDNYVVNATLLILLNIINKSVTNDFRDFIRSHLYLDKPFLLKIGDELLNEHKITKIINVNELSYTFTLMIK